MLFHQIRQGLCRLQDLELGCSRAGEAEAASEEGYIRLLKRCCDLRAVEQGRRVHAHIAKCFHFPFPISLRVLLVRMYVVCGSLAEARSVLDGIGREGNVWLWNAMLGAYAQSGHIPECWKIFSRAPERNVYSWNSLLEASIRVGDLRSARSSFDRMPEWNAISCTVLSTAYAQKGHIDESREIFDRMQDKDPVARNSMIQSYARIGDLDQARALFDTMEHKTLVSWTTMIRAYAQKGQIDEAREMFDCLKEPDAVAWNIMIQAYTDTFRLREAEELFERMPEPDPVTCTLMLSAYSETGHVNEAKSLFDRFKTQDVISWNSMITAYGKCGRVAEAKEMFDRIPNHGSSPTSSNAMIGAYARAGHIAEARSLFDRMAVRTEASWITLLAGYIDNELLTEARSLFECARDKSVTIWNAMIGGYAQAGHMEEAESLFRRIPEPNAVTWDALVSGYVKQGDGDRAFGLFKLMDVEGVKPMVITCTNMLDACSTFSSPSGLVAGKLVHASLSDCRLDSGIIVRNALMNMYGKCGSLEDAWSVFDASSPRRRNVVSWNIMLSAYAHNGRDSDVLELFRVMNLEGGQPPNRVTLVTVMTACSHGGMLLDGLDCFASIRADFGVELHEDHYKCMVDLLGRSGQLQAAEKFIQSLPFQADDGVWTAFLSACNSQGSILQGAKAAEGVLGRISDTPSLYVLVSNMHATGSDP